MFVCLFFTVYHKKVAAQKSLSIYTYLSTVSPLLTLRCTPNW